MPAVEKDQNSRAKEHDYNPSFFFSSITESLFKGIVRCKRIPYKGLL